MGIFNNSRNLPPFDPLTIVRDWGNGQAFRIADALTGVAAFGATGSGKTSGVARHLALGYLAGGFGGLVLCAKKDEREQWQRWAREVGREDDLVIFDASGRYKFNFMDWDASRKGEGGGSAINTVAMLDEIAGAVAGSAGSSEGGGDNKFFEDALHYMNTNLVELPILAGFTVSLPLLRSIANSAPLSAKELASEEWQRSSACAAMIREAKSRVTDENSEEYQDLKECINYWTQEFPNLSEKTRSIITLSFAMMVRPFVTRPLRKLFSSPDTNITPEDAFKGKIIIIDLPVQEFRLAGRMANLVWKYCFQIAVLRRTKPKEAFLRPVFLWADEAQNFISDFDSEYQAVARSAGGCTVYLTQNRESYRRVLGNDDSVDSLLGNLQAKFFCQNSGETNEWASKLLGERWQSVTGTGTSHDETVAI